MNLDAPRETQYDAFKCIFLKFREWFSKTPDEQKKILRRIERSCYSHTVKECESKHIQRRWENPMFINRYATECYRILSNIDPATSDGTLGKKILSGEVDVRNICSMSSYELNPHASQAERDELDIRMNQRVDKKYSDEVCKKCGEQTVIRVKAQTRAADEIASFHRKCETCGNTWGG